MPKLNNEIAQKVDKAASDSGFTPMDPGQYRARLSKVEAKNAASSGNPMWTWEYEVVQEPYVGRKQWNNTVLTDAAMWKLAETFSAFGVSTDTDTDELIGCTVLLNVTQRVIPTGNKAGQTGNNVDQVMPDVDPAAVRHAESEHKKGNKAAAKAGGVTPTATKQGAAAAVAGEF